MRGFCSITSQPHSIFCIRLKVASRHRDKLAHGRKIINVSSEESKGKKQTNKQNKTEQKQKHFLCT